MSMFFPAFFLLPFLFSEATLPVLLFLHLSGAGAGPPADLSGNLPDDVVAYVRIVHQPEAAAAVRKAVDEARSDEEFRVLMDRMIADLEEEAGFKSGGFAELTKRIRGVHVAVYSFGKEEVRYSLVFEATSEEAARELLDHSDRFFEEATFQKLEGEDRYSFAPAGDEGLAVRVGNLVMFGTAAEETAAALARAPEKTLAASESYRRAVGEAGDAILLGTANGSRFFSDLRSTLDFDDQKEMDQADSFIGFTEFEFLRLSAAFRDGRLANETVLGFPEDAVFRVFEPKAAELDLDLFVRAGALSGFGLQISDPKAYWKKVEAHLLEQEKALGWEDISEGLDEFKEGMGGRTVADVLALLDGRLVVGLPDMTELLSEEMSHGEMEEERPTRDFPVAVAIRLADPAGAEKLLDWLLAEGPLSEGAEKIEPTTYQGVTIRGFVADAVRYRWYLDGDVLVVGGKDLEASLDRVRGEGAAAARAEVAERLGRLGPAGFASFGGSTGSGMMGWMFFFVGARASAMPGPPGMPEKHARRVPYRQPVRVSEARTDMVGSARFEPVGFIARSNLGLSGAAVQQSTGLILRMYFEQKVSGCLQSLSTIYTLLHRYHGEHEKFPATLDEAMALEEGYWMMGCREVPESMEKPSAAFAYLAEKPAGVSDEEALWVYENEQRHPFGRTVLYRDGKVTFLYEDEFQQALAKSR